MILAAVILLTAAAIICDYTVDYPIRRMINAIRRRFH
jgi:hypothetical protein